MVLVPREPTQVMVDEGDNQLDFGAHGSARDVWDAMLASSPVAPVGAPTRHIEGFLCRAWGESDKTAAALCGDMAAVRQFLIDEWLGDESSPDWEGNPILPGVMDELAAYSWADEGNVWQTAFEIGGLSIERVTFQGCELATDATKTA